MALLRLVDGDTLALVGGGRMQLSSELSYSRKLVPLASRIRGGVSPLIQGPNVVLSAIAENGGQVEPISADFIIYQLGGDEVRSGSATVNDEVISFSMDPDDYGTENRALVRIDIASVMYPETGYIHVAR